ncbi:beta-lactamase class A [Lacticaseibacillus paracasei subsp. paracasei Lpp126]|uniref:Beta-lactamase class A n=1 Tax=Lacticaseibacillus paracasei subsp. paracasei Lpp126 TaxID=1256206 RepID=S2RXM3_LACPA|nr:beta-lactamase class A [Lacticaseibacillus paracasei subsp. paracasei Lpp126]
MTQFDYDRQTAMAFSQQVGHLIVQAFQEKRDRFL